MREVHEIHVDGSWHCAPNDPVGYLYNIGRKKSDGTYVIPTGNLDTITETYEEALEEGLKQALSLIGEKND